MDSPQIDIHNELYRLLESLGHEQVELYGDSYWRLVLTTTRDLMRLRDYGMNPDEFVRAFRVATKRLLEVERTALHEDLILELDAILIHRYPMYDFWTSSFDYFASHINFKKYRE